MDSMQLGRLRPSFEGQSLPRHLLAEVPVLPVPHLKADRPLTAGSGQSLPVDPRLRRTAWGRVRPYKGG
jgi:hypothetical protein